MTRALALSVLLVGAAARAQTPAPTPEPTLLRMAAIAPEGTSWARELKAFARGVEAETGGALRIKWYLGGMAGDEAEEVSRIRRDQLDGGAGAMICDILAPSLAVTRVAGLLRTRAEASRVVNMLTPTIAEEFQRHGFVFLGAAGFGLDVIFSRTPIRSLADLRRGHYWIRKYDDVLRSTLTAMGVQLVELPYADALHAYAEGRIDGFVSTPASALAFQWAAQVRAYTDVKLAYLPGCMTISTRAFDKLPFAQQQAVRNQAATLAVRFEDVGKELDRQLLDEIFSRHGLVRVVPSPEFRRELDATFLAARATLDAKLVSPALLSRTLRALAPK
ncbi:MAG: TRAP transporter substrate-binding protein DctP [Polyangia bacterium]